MNEPTSSESRRELLRERVGMGMLDMLRRAEEIRDLAAKREGLHSTDFACIAYLAELSGPVNAKSIVSRLGLKSGSGTALLDRLEKAGYVHRLPNPDDRRGVLIELDRAAAAEPIERYRQMQDSYRCVTNGFTDEELAVVARFLEKMGDVKGPAQVR